MAREFDPYKLSSPRVYLARMIIFLIIAGFVPVVLYRQIVAGFLANPMLNGLIFGVLFIGILLAFRNVIRLMPEVRWVNNFRRRERGYDQPAPRLLAPMATLLRDKMDRMALSTSTWRSLLDSIVMRLDENREILRYMTGLLVFLGLLGTFWGLLTTIGAVSDTLNSLGAGSTETGVAFEDLRNGLQAPLSGMGIAFSSSLFGLASSLILGFLDLQAGQAQNRFYTELEDWLSTVTDLDDVEMEGGETGNTVQEIKVAVDRLSRSVSDGGANRAATAAMANLAEGIQGLVQHMRAEQQLVRDWVENQADQQRMLQRTLDRIADRGMDRLPARREGREDREERASISEFRREG